MRTYTFGRGGPFGRGLIGPGLAPNRLDNVVRFRRPGRRRDVSSRKRRISDMYEIRASQLAETKATSADVKTFANRMITDHTKTSDQLEIHSCLEEGMTAPTADRCASTRRC